MYTTGRGSIGCPHYPYIDWSICTFNHDPRMKNSPFKYNLNYKCTIMRFLWRQFQHLKKKKKKAVLFISSLKYRLDQEVEVEDFQKYSEKVQASLYGCPVESPPVALLHKKGKNSSKAKGNRNKKVWYKLLQYHSRVFQYSPNYGSQMNKDNITYMKERILLLYIFHHCKWLPWHNLCGLHLHHSLLLEL